MTLNAILLLTEACRINNAVRALIHLSLAIPVNTIHRLTNFTVSCVKQNSDRPQYLGEQAKFRKLFFRNVTTSKVKRLYLTPCGRNDVYFRSIST